MIGTAKIEVDKGDKQNYFFTGKLEEFRQGYYRIHTIKNEDLIFRKEQVVQIEILDDMIGEKLGKST